MTSPASTLLCTAIAATLAADATVRTLCGRASQCVVAWQSIASAQVPVIALLVTFAEEIDGIDEPWGADVLLTAVADGPRGLETAEALAQRARELVATLALTTPAAMQATPERVNTRTITDDELVPPGRARVDLEVHYRVEVL